MWSSEHPQRLEVRSSALNLGRSAMKLKEIAFAISLIVAPAAEATVSQSGVLPLSPGALGQPRIYFSDVSAVNKPDFFINRGVAGNVACLGGSTETRQYDASSNMTWCLKSVNIQNNGASYTLAKTNTANGANWIYTDKLVQVDDYDPSEYKYTVQNRAAADPKINVAQVWAASCGITDNQDPLLAWVSSFNSRVGANPGILTRSDIPDPSATSVPNLTSKTASYNGTSTTIYIYSNDKYVAVFSARGDLLGLTHRALGTEFITRSAGTATNTPQNFLISGAEYGWLVKYGSATNYDEGSSCASQSGSGISLLYAQQGSVATPTTDANGKLTFTWSGLPNGVTVSNTWTLQSNDGVTGSSAGLRGKLTVTGSAPSGGYICAAFPNLAGLGLPSGLDSGANTGAVLPSGRGGNPNNTGSEITNYSTLPSSYRASMSNGLQAQFTGFERGNFGLYWAAEDGAYQPKSFVLQNYSIAAGSSKAGRSFVDQFPAGGTGTIGNSLQQNYDTVIRPMCGGWSRMAKQYGKWATQQSWALNTVDSTPRLTSTRTDISKKVRDGLFWWSSFLSNTNTPRDQLDYVQDTSLTGNLKAEIGMTSTGGNVPIGIHLYQWYSEIFDQSVPQFTQKAAGSDGLTMPLALANIRSDGTLVVPYINANFADITNRTSPVNAGCAPNATHGWWNQPFTYGGVSSELLDQDVMQRAAPSLSGENLYIFCNPTAGALLASIDPSLPAWRQILATNVNNVFNMGGDGVYLDTYGHGYHPDFSTTHGHVVGHGNWWLNGEITNGADTVQRAAQDMPSGTRNLVTAEYFNEKLMPYIDIVMNYERPRFTDVPLLWSVYSGRQIYAGAPPAAATTDAARTGILGRGFVWGYQLGLTTPTGLCGSATGRCDPAHIVTTRICDSFFLMGNCCRRRMISTPAAVMLSITPTPLLAVSVPGATAPLQIAAIPAVPLRQYAEHVGATRHTLMKLLF